MVAKPEIQSYFDANTSTWTYLVVDPATKACAVIDTVLDFDMQSASTTTKSADDLIAVIKKEGLTLEWILETHVHADHLTASAYIKQQFGGKPRIAIGEHIKDVLTHWVPIFNLTDFPTDGSQFDKLFVDGDEFSIGSLLVKVIHTPGHTPACVTYVCGGVAFVGDTIFMPEVGTARTDFPGGSAATMYESCRALMAALPHDTVIHVGHDYPGKDKQPMNAATIAEHLKSNCMMNERVSKDEFIEANKEELPVPRLLLPALQVNLRAGKLGAAVGPNTLQYLVIPLNMFNKKVPTL